MHALVRAFVPSPQVAEQVISGCQSLHCPSTEMIILRDLAAFRLACLVDIPGQEEDVPQFSVSVCSPVQFAPPFDGAGSSQVLVCAFVPCPQVTEQMADTVQVLQRPSTEGRNLRVKNEHLSWHSLCYSILGHGCGLQGVVSVISPTQSSPPFEGGGLSQVLSLKWLPSPHVLVQTLCSPQLVQFPCTKCVIRDKLEHIPPHAHALYYLLCY